MNCPNCDNPRYKLLHQHVDGYELGKCSRSGCNRIFAVKGDVVRQVIVMKEHYLVFYNEEYK